MANAGEGEQVEGLWADELREAPGGKLSWLWEGYLAAGGCTLLTSQWKAGKTTLVSLLLARLKTGAALLERPLVEGKAIVVSEEPPYHWVERHRLLDFGRQVSFYCRPFLGKPTLKQWLDFLDRLAERCQKEGFKLVVIDTLAFFLPGSDEANAASMLAGLMPLRKLTRLGVAVLLLHHPRKGLALPGQSARGSGALTGYVDVQLELRFYRPDDLEDRHRHLTAYSRHPETPKHLLIELNAEKTDYAVCPDQSAAELESEWQPLRLVLEDAERKLTRRQILAEWPEDFQKPAEISLWRWLERLVVQGEVCRDGTGRKVAPFRYWLPHKETKWLNDPIYQLLEQGEKLTREYTLEDLMDLSRAVPGVDDGVKG